jgi:hypothetical protein
MVKLNKVIHFWKFKVDDVDDDDLRVIQIKESKGECAFEGKATDIVVSNYGHPIEIKKHNINTDEVPKMDIIADY